MSGKTLAGRKALVTGGARGIGAAIAEALAKAGKTDEARKLPLRRTFRNVSR